MSKIIQNHHTQYLHPKHPSMTDIVFPIWKGEHFILNKIQMFCKKEVSEGFLQSLRIFIAQRELGAIKLEKK